MRSLNILRAFWAWLWYGSESQQLTDATIRRIRQDGYLADIAREQEETPTGRRASKEVPSPRKDTALSRTWNGR